MVENNPPAPPDRSRAPVIPLPIALYVSGELIFELYDGGQPDRKFSIRWERLVPAKESEPEAATQSTQTGLRTHQD
jgi:hypothetical protein